MTLNYHRRELVSCLLVMTVTVQVYGDMADSEDMAMDYLGLYHSPVVISTSHK